MKNKIVGYLVIGIAVLMGFIIYSYHTTLAKLQIEECPITGAEFCIHEELANQQISINIAILVLVVALGIYLILFSKEERVVTKLLKVKEQLQPKNITKENYARIFSSLDADEKNILEKIIDAKGSLVQSALVDSERSKVKVTRILDRLEGKGIIERKRRGMTNIVLLKHTH